MSKKIKIKDLLDPELAEKHYPALAKYFEKGGTWCQLMDIPEGALESQYADGYEHYQGGRFDEAGAAFATLTLLNPYQPKYWFALGAARYQSGDPSEAAQAFDLAAALDENDPTLRLHGAKCYVELNERDKAKTHLAEAERLLADHPLRDSLEREIRIIKGELK